jgi:hypothetical protein
VYGDSESHRNVLVNFSSNSPPLISHCAAPVLSAFAELSLLATRYQLTAYDTAWRGSWRFPWPHWTKISKKRLAEGLNIL